MTLPSVALCLQWTDLWAGPLLTFAGTKVRLQMGPQVVHQPTTPSCAARALAGVHVGMSVYVSKHGPHPAPILPLGHPSNLKIQDPQAGGPVHPQNGVPVPMQALGHLGKEFWNPRRQSMAWKGGMGTPPGPRGLLSPRGMARPEKREYRVMV